MVVRAVVLAALAALLAAGCGGGSSEPEGPPDLVFVSLADDDYAIFRADADGGNVSRLTDDKGDPASPQGLFFQVEPAWSPDGSKIAFVSLRDGPKSHVFTMLADGTGTTRLTNSDKGDDHPSWSPDGKWIVFAREGAIFRIAASGGEATRIDTGPGAAASPSYSPDGTRIAYDYRTPGSAVREVYVMSADGTGRRPVTNLRGVSSIASWSPDGSRLVFQSDAYVGNTDIYTLALSGGEPKRVTTDPVDEITPAWTPEGSVSFSRDGALYVTAGGKEEQLTDGDDIDAFPAWRPVTPQ